MNGDTICTICDDSYVVLQDHDSILLGCDASTDKDLLLTGHALDSDHSKASNLRSSSYAHTFGGTLCRVSSVD